MEETSTYVVSVEEERRTVATFFVTACNPDEAREKAENHDCEDSDYLHEEDYQYDWSSAQVVLKEDKESS